MTTVRVQIDGVPRWERAVDELVLRLSEATYLATSYALHLLEREEKVLLTTYPHPKGTPTPSPPWIGPVGLISGHLRRGVRVDGPWQMSMTMVEGEVGPTAVYARIQELGGYTGRGHRTFLPPRPYHRPTLDASLSEIHQAYADAWARAIHTAAGVTGA